MAGRRRNFKWNLSEIYSAGYAKKPVKLPSHQALKLALKPFKNSMKVFKFFAAAVTKPDENYRDQ